MAKTSSLTLPVLAVLVLVGAGVVFLGPQLTGHQIYGQQIATGNIQQATYLYPVAVADYDLVMNSSFAVGGNDPNYATLDYNTVHYSGDHGVVHCPNYPIFRLVEAFDSRRQEVGNGFCAYNQSYPPYYSGYHFSGWLQTTSSFRENAATTSAVINPKNITSVQVNASELYDNIGTPEAFLPGGNYRVYIKAKCTKKFSTYSIKYLGECIVPENQNGRICTKVIGTSSGCPSGKWTVNRVIIGNSFIDPGHFVGDAPGSVAEPSPGSGTRAHIHWIRLVQTSDIS